jgi:hypothetical protein
MSTIPAIIAISVVGGITVFLGGGYLYNKMTGQGMSNNRNSDPGIELDVFSNKTPDHDSDHVHIGGRKSKKQRKPEKKRRKQSRKNKK